MIIGIVATTKDLAIGKDGKLPWHYAEDLRFFKRTTTGNAVVMGMNTWNSIGRPLPNRLNIVLSRNERVELPEGVVLLKSRDALLMFAKYLTCDIYMIGGAKTYQNFADVIDKWIVTEVPIEVADADVFMPDDFLAGFSPENTIELGAGLKVRQFRRTGELV